MLDNAGLNKLMNFKLDGLASSVLLFELMDCAVVDRTKNNWIREGDSLWVTKDILQHVLDLPTCSTKELLEPEDTEPGDQEYINMTKALKYVTETYKPKEKEEKNSTAKSLQKSDTSARIVRRQENFTVI